MIARVSEFCFVVHPTSLDDVARFEPGAATKRPALVRKLLAWMPPHAIARVTGIRTPQGRETSGWFVAVPLLPEQMLALPREAVYDAIGAAVAIGAGLGAQVAGLGAFTGVVGDGGVTVAARAPIPVTTGNSLTIAAGVRSLLRGAAAMEIDAREATLCIVGATGSIGAACAELLAPHVARIVLVARNRTRLERLRATLEPHVACELRVAADVRDGVRDARLVLTATSSTMDLIEPADLRAGAVVCELSLPHDVGRRVARERPDVLVTEGGNLHVPGALRAERLRGGGAFDFGLPAGEALACMAETMLLALDERHESYSLGRGIDLANVRAMDERATQAGFALAGMRAFDRAITPETIAAIRQAASAAAW